uniref:Uncharacterized protein n=1 Tax=Anguilla anguilla TaxID=7936 RepID=A0A0E9RJ14_ANGAN
MNYFFQIMVYSHNKFTLRSLKSLNLGQAG